MHKVNGRVLVKETGEALPNLIVALFDHDSAAPSAAPGGSSISPGAQSDFGERLGSVLTDANGAFHLEFDVHLFAAADPEKRPDLVLAVFAPEDSQGPGQPMPLSPPQRLLLFSNVPRQNAGNVEAYALRITRAQLDRFGIFYGRQDAASTDIAESTLEIWQHRDEVRRQLTPRMRQENLRIRETKARARERFMNLSAVPAPKRDRFFVRRGESQEARHHTQMLAIEEGIDQVGGYSGGMRLRLTDEQLGRLGLPVIDGRVNGDVDVAAVLAEASGRAGRDMTRARRLVDACHEEDVLATAFVPPSDRGEQLPVVSAEPNPAAPSEQLLSRILGQIRDLEETGADGIATRADAQRLQAEIDALRLTGGPADAVALHDFTVLQMAFKHVWTEAFDETVRASAEALYTQAVQLADERGVDFLDVGAVGETSELLDFIYRVRQDDEDLLPVPDVVGDAFPQITESLWNALSGDQRTLVQQHANGFSGSTAEGQETLREWVKTILLNPQGPLARVRNLALEIGARLAEPHSFHVFAPDSYNFGILATYRQRWEPLAYQAGDLAATLPLAPGETRKFTQRVTVRKSRSERELEKSISSRREESAQTSRADAEIVRKASTATNFKASAEGSFNVGIAGLSATTAFARNQADESADVKKDFREAVVRAAQDYSRERSLEITTSSSEDVETSTSGELSNPNNELTVTYLLYELQRRYRISEHLQRLTPVVLVAQDVPAPHEIDEAWLLTNDWVLRRVLLDDALKPALDYLREGFAGDEVGLEVKRANWQAQKDLVGTLETSLGAQLTARDALRGALVSNIEQRGQVEASDTSFAQDLAAGIATGGLSLFGSSGPDQAELLKANRKAIELMLGYEDQKVAEFQQKLTRALDGLQKATDELTRGLQQQSNKRTAIDQLRVHVKANILYYMQAIWSHEPPDQRFFRLYDLDIQWVSVPAGTVRILGNTLVGNQNLFLVDIDGMQAFLPSPGIPTTSRKLIEIADLDNMLGFKGNYMMFRLKEPCYLTTFMMQEFVDDYFGVRDPDPFGNYTTGELLDYIECAYHRAETTDEDRATLRDLLIDRLNSPRRDSEEISVPTGKLFIEALPGAHPLLEDFKLLHRSLDVRKVRADVREAELENLRRAARLLVGDREDPEIDKRVLVQGTPNVIVEPA